MKQVIYGGFWDLIINGDASPKYSVLKSSGWETAAAEVGTAYPVSTPGTIRKLYVKLVDATGAAVSPGAGTSYTFTFRVNYADTALTVTISGAATEGSDTTNNIGVVAGDLVGLKVSWTGLPTDCYVRTVVEFQGNNEKESILFGGGGLCSAAGTLYGGFTIHDQSGATESDIRQIMPASGTIKNLYALLNAVPSPGQATEGYDITLRVNGVNTALTCFIGGDDTTGEDTTNEVTVAAGDVLTVGMVPTGPPANSPGCFLGFLFVADDDRESPLPNGNGRALNTGATAYTYLAWNMEAWSTNEYEKKQLALKAILKSLYVEVSAAPGIGKSWTFTVRVNGVDTDLAVTISGTNTTGQDITHEVSISDGDYIDIKCEPSGTPAAASAHWGLVSLVVENPTLTTDPATAVGTTSSTPNGTLDDDGGEACVCGFEWGETIAYEHGATPTQSKVTGETFSQVIIGLDPNTTYHFRAFATNSAGTSYGADRTFTTSALPPAVIIPTVTTNPASAISQVSAALNGFPNDDGGEACDCGFEWGLDIGYGITTPTQSRVTGESFSQAIHGLFPGLTYHFRALATNSAGTGYGADRSFTSTPPLSRAHALSREEL